MHCSPQHTTCPYDTIDDDTTPTILITTSLICLYLTTSRHRLLISSSPTPNGSSVSPRSSGTSPPRVASPLALHCSSRILSQKFVASPRLVFVPFVCFVNLCTIIAYPSASIVSFRVRVVTTLPLPYPTLPSWTFLHLIPASPSLLPSCVAWIPFERTLSLSTLSPPRYRAFALGSRMHSRGLSLASLPLRLFFVRVSFFFVDFIWFGYGLSSRALVIQSQIFSSLLYSGRAMCVFKEDILCIPVHILYHCQ